MGMGGGGQVDEWCRDAGCEREAHGGVDWVLLNHSPLYFHSLGSIAESDTLPWCGPSL